MSDAAETPTNITLLQDKPAHAESLAKHFEELAARARAGDILSHSGILTLPNEAWETTLYSDCNSLKLIGMHTLCIMRIRDRMLNG